MRRQLLLATSPTCSVGHSLRTSVLEQKARSQVQPMFKKIATRALPAEMMPEENHEKLSDFFFLLLSCAPSGVLKL